VTVTCRLTPGHTRTGTANNITTVTCRHTGRQSRYQHWPTTKSTKKYNTVTNKQRKIQTASLFWLKKKSTTRFLASVIHIPFGGRWQI